MPQGTLSQTAKERHPHSHFCAGQYLPIPRIFPGTGVPIRTGTRSQHPANCLSGRCKRPKHPKNCVIRCRTVNHDSLFGVALKNSKKHEKDNDDNGDAEKPKDDRHESSPGEVVQMKWEFKIFCETDVLNLVSLFCAKRGPTPHQTVVACLQIFSRDLKTRNHPFYWNGAFLVERYSCQR